MVDSLGIRRFAGDSPTFAFQTSKVLCCVAVLKLGSCEHMRTKNVAMIWGDSIVPSTVGGLTRPTMERS